MLRMAAPVTDLLTIDQLAERTGVSVRTIRFYAGRGLLPAPQLRGRTGLYGPGHVARLSLICELSALGFTLAAIEAQLDGSPEVKSYLYESKDEAYARFQQQFSQQPELVQNTPAACGRSSTAVRATRIGTDQLRSRFITSRRVTPGSTASSSGGVRQPSSPRTKTLPREVSVMLAGRSGPTGALK